MAQVAIYVDNIGTTTASGRVNFFNANPSIGVAGYVSLWRDVYTFVDSDPGVRNTTATLNWTMSGLSAGTTYDLDAVGHPTQTTDFFDALFQTNAVSAPSVSFTTLAPAPSWTDNTITTTARVGSYYSSSISASNATSYTFSGLPPGISQSGSSGSISGTPTTAQTYPVTFYATGPGGDSDPITRSITVKNRLPSWSDSTVSTNMRQGVSYSDAVSANYVSYYTSSGTLPPGLSFNTSNGSFSGTPTTPGSYTFAFQAFNADGEGVGTSNFTATVKYPLATWNDDTVSTVFSVGTPYSDSISANNAAGYAVASGALPDGVTLDTSTGAVSGVPAVGGVFNFTLAAYNGSSEYIYTAPYQVTVDDPGGKFFVYEGSSWVEKEPYYYNGNWNSRAVVYYYNGSTWEKTLP